MTPEERREVLGLVATGKISVDEAARLLHGEPAAAATAGEKATAGGDWIPVEEEAAKPARELAPVKATASGRGRWLHVHVNDLKSGSRRVAVNIPLRLVQAGLALGGQFAPELKSFNWDEINAALLDEQGGMIVEVKDEEDGEHVQIFID